MKRVLVIGHPGSGKSTFAAQLGKIIGLPVVHLDKEFWQPGWEMTQRELFRQRVGDLVAADSWIIDGSYDSTLDIRLPRADTVIMLDFPRNLCMLRILQRIVTNFGRVRADMGDGCPEKIDVEFFRFAWNYKRDRYPRINVALRTHFPNGKVIALKGPAAVVQFLSEARFTP